MSTLRLLREFCMKTRGRLLDLLFSVVIVYTNAYLWSVLCFNDCFYIFIFIFYFSCGLFLLHFPFPFLSFFFFVSFSFA